MPQLRIAPQLENPTEGGLVARQPRRDAHGKNLVILRFFVIHIMESNISRLCEVPASIFRVRGRGLFKFGELSQFWLFRHGRQVVLVVLNL